MDTWLKLVIIVLVGIAALSLIGVLLNVLVGLALFILKIIFVLIFGLLALKIGQELLRKLRR